MDPLIFSKVINTVHHGYQSRAYSKGIVYLPKILTQGAFTMGDRTPWESVNAIVVLLPKRIRRYSPSALDRSGALQKSLKQQTYISNRHRMAEKWLEP